MDANILTNISGVVLATLGGVLAWFFLGQIDYTDRKEFLKGNSTMTVYDSTPERRRELLWNIWLSRFGIVLIVLGAVLQIWSNFLPSKNVCEIEAIPVLIRFVVCC